MAKCINLDECVDVKFAFLNYKSNQSVNPLIIGSSNLSPFPPTIQKVVIACTETTALVAHCIYVVILE